MVEVERGRSDNKMLWKHHFQVLLAASGIYVISRRWNYQLWPLAARLRPASEISPIQFNAMLPPSSLTICLCCSDAVQHFVFLNSQGTPLLEMVNHHLPPPPQSPLPTSSSAASLSSDLINFNHPLTLSDGHWGPPRGLLWSDNWQEYKLGRRAEEKQKHQGVVCDDTDVQWI